MITENNFSEGQLTININLPPTLQTEVRLHALAVRLNCMKHKNHFILSESLSGDWRVSHKSAIYTTPS